MNCKKRSRLIFINNSLFLTDIFRFILMKINWDRNMTAIRFRTHAVKIICQRFVFIYIILIIFSFNILYYHLKIYRNYNGNIKRLFSVIFFSFNIYNSL